MVARTKPRDVFFFDLSMDAEKGMLCYRDIAAKRGVEEEEKRQKWKKKGKMHRIKAVEGEKMNHLEGLTAY